MTGAAIALQEPVTAVFRRTIWSEKSDTRPFMPGATIEEIVSAFDRPPEFERFGGVYLKRDPIDPGMVVPRLHWHRVRPKPGTMLFVSLIPEGGGDDAGGGGGVGGKQVFMAVAALALIVVSYGVAAGGLGFLSPVLAAGEIGAKAVAAAVVIGGSLALQTPEHISRS